MASLENEIEGKAITLLTGSTAVRRLKDASADVVFPVILVYATPVGEHPASPAGQLYSGFLEVRIDTYVLNDKNLSVLQGLVNTVRSALASMIGSRTALTNYTITRMREVQGDDESSDKVHSRTVIYEYEAQK